MIIFMIRRTGGKLRVVWRIAIACLDVHDLDPAVPIAAERAVSSTVTAALQESRESIGDDVVDEVPETWNPYRVWFSRRALELSLDVPCGFKRSLIAQRLRGPVRRAIGCSIKDFPSLFRSLPQFSVACGLRTEDESARHMFMGGRFREALGVAVC